MNQHVKTYQMNLTRFSVSIPILKLVGSLNHHYYFNHYNENKVITKLFLLKQNSNIKDVSILYLIGIAC